METRNHTVFHLSVGGALLAGGCTVVLGACVLLAHCDLTPQPKRDRGGRLFPRIGEIGSSGNQVVNASESREAVLEASYGPVNKAALSETKEGLFGRIRSNIQTRRCQRIYRRAVRAGCLQTASSCRTTVTHPVYRQPKPQPVYPATPSPQPNRPLNVPTGPLDIRPSERALPVGSRDQTCPDGRCPQKQDFKPFKQSEAETAKTSPKVTIPDTLLQSGNQLPAFESRLLMFRPRPDALDIRRSVDPTVGYSPPLPIVPSE